MLNGNGCSNQLALTINNKWHKLKKKGGKNTDKSSSRSEKANREIKAVGKTVDSSDNNTQSITIN